VELAGPRGVDEGMLPPILSEPGPELPTVDAAAWAGAGEGLRGGAGEEAGSFADGAGGVLGAFAGDAGEGLADGTGVAAFVGAAVGAAGAGEEAPLLCLAASIFFFFLSTWGSLTTGRAWVVGDMSPNRSRPSAGGRLEPCDEGWDVSAFAGVAGLGCSSGGGVGAADVAAAAAAAALESVREGALGGSGAATGGCWFRGCLGTAVVVSDGCGASVGPPGREAAVCVSGGATGTLPVTAASPFFPVSHES
jgi:hypothetical protein